MRIFFPSRVARFPPRYGRSRRVDRARVIFAGAGAVCAASAYLAATRGDIKEVVQMAFLPFVALMLGILAALFSLSAGSRMVEGGLYADQIPWGCILRKGDLGLIPWADFTSALTFEWGTAKGVRLTTDDGRTASFGTYADRSEYEAVLARIAELGLPTKEDTTPRFIEKYTKAPPRAGWKTDAVVAARKRDLVKARWTLVIGLLGSAVLIALAIQSYGDRSTRWVSLLAGAGGPLGLLATRGWARGYLRPGPFLGQGTLYGNRIPWRAVLRGSPLGEVAPADIRAARLVRGGFMPARLIVSFGRRGKGSFSFMNEHEIEDMLEWLREAGVEVRDTQVAMEGLWTRVVSDEPEGDPPDGKRGPPGGPRPPV